MKIAFWMTTRIFDSFQIHYQISYSINVTFREIENNVIKRPRLFHTILIIACVTKHWKTEEIKFHIENQEELCFFN